MINEKEERDAKSAERNWSERENVILNIAVQINDQETGTLTIYEDDKIEDKVKNFCHEFNLDPKEKKRLNQQVINELDAQIALLEGHKISMNPLKGSKKKEIPYNKRKKELNEDNAGSRLYIEGMERKRKRDAERKKILQEEALEKDKDLIFVPKIDENSKRMMGNRSPFPRIEDKLIKDGSISKRKALLEIEKQREEEEKKFKFRPEITENTKYYSKIKRKCREEELPEKLISINPEYLSGNLSKSADNLFSKENFDDSNTDNLSTNNHSDYYRTQYVPKHKVNKRTKIFQREVPVPKICPRENLHDYLYLESKIIEERKEKERRAAESKIYPFKPIIKNKSKNNSFRKKETENQFFTRLAKSKSKSTYKNKEEEEDSINESFESKKIFRSQVMKEGKSSSRRREDFFDKKISEGERKMKKTEEEEKLKKSKLFQGRSKEIIIRMKFEKYKEIFNALDSDGDGLISVKRIRLSAIDQDLLEDLTPILEELQQKETEMNFKEFCLKVDKFLAGKIFTEEELSKLM